MGTTDLHKAMQLAEHLNHQQLNELVFFIKGRLKALEQAACMPDSNVVNECVNGAIKFKLQYIKCGKKRCKCATGEGHGPYWYAYWWQNGQTRSKYIGKNLLKQVQDEGTSVDT